MLIIAVITFYGCERIEFDPGIESLNEHLPVVDAVLGNHDDYRTITLSRTAPYMDGTEVEKIDNATVSVSGPDRTYIFEHTEDGKYLAPANFTPGMDTTYHLSVNIDGEIYEAESTMRPPVNLHTLNVNQDRWEGDDNIYEVTAWLKDNAIEDERFVFKYAVNEFLYDSTSVWSLYTDQITNNVWLENVVLFGDIEAAPGDQIDIYALSISPEYYDFIQAAEKNRMGSNPFSPPGGIPITGNISNGALGIFQISAIIQETVTVPDKDE